MSRNEIEKDLKHLIDSDSLSKHIPDPKKDDLSLWRKRIILKTGRMLRTKHGLPSKAVKEAHAKALIKLYPILKSEILPLGYEHHYDPKKIRDSLNIT